MKAIVITVMTLIASAAFGKNTKPAGEFVAGDIVKAESLCPTGVICMVGGTRLTIEVTIKNCESIDSIDEVQTNDGSIGLSAYVFTYPKGTPVDQPIFCPQMIMKKSFQVTLVDVLPPFDVSFKGTDTVVTVDALTKK